MAAGKKQKPWWRIVTIRPNESFTGAIAPKKPRPARRKEKRT